jgi:hypothetical protein
MLSSAVPLGFEIKNSVNIDQINRCVRTFQRQSLQDCVCRFPGGSSIQLNFITICLSGDLSGEARQSEDGSFSEDGPATV